MQTKDLDDELYSMLCEWFQEIRETIPRHLKTKWELVTETALGNWSVMLSHVRPQIEPCWRHLHQESAVCNTCKAAYPEFCPCH